jgi:hypothetical protein
MAILYITKRSSVGMLVKWGLDGSQVARVGELEPIVLEFVRLRGNSGSERYGFALLSDRVWICLCIDFPQRCYDLVCVVGDGKCCRKRRLEMKFI